MATDQDYAFVEMSPEQLELFIGNELVKGEFGAKDLTDSEKRSAARRWFEANLVRFRGEICSNSIIRGTFFGKGKQDRNVLFASVLDIVAKLGGFPVPIAAVAARIIHYGLDRLCEDVPGSKPS